MQHPDSTIVDIAVGLLFPAAPNSLLGRATGVAKSTARSWRRHRRPPMSVLRLLRAELQRRGAECFSTLRELEILIANLMPTAGGGGPDSDALALMLARQLKPK